MVSDTSFFMVLGIIVIIGTAFSWNIHKHVKGMSIDDSPKTNK